MKKKLLYIGVQEFSEKMYPHLFDTLTCLKNNFALQSYIITDRGSSYYNIGTIFSKYVLEIKNQFNLKGLFSLLSYKIILVDIKLLIGLLFEYFKFQREVKKYKQDIQSIFSRNQFDVILIHDLFNLFLIPDEILLNNKVKKKFWSFEIITLDQSWFRESFLIRKMLKVCKKKIANVDEIYIQDYNRATVFDNHMNTHYVPKKYLPVSIMKNSFSAELKPFSKSGDKKEIILAQIGAIYPMRGTIKLIEAYQHCNSNIKLVLKGSISGTITNYIEKVQNKPSAYPIAISFNEMRKFISGVDIGFIGLAEPDLGQYFYSKSSGQMIEFTNCAIPLIVYGLPELADFVEQHGCGISVNLEQPSDLQDAINKIIKNYEQYSRAAANVYEKYYNLDNYIELVMNSMKN